MFENELVGKKIKKIVVGEKLSIITEDGLELVARVSLDYNKDGELVPSLTTILDRSGRIETIETKDITSIYNGEGKKVHELS